MNTPVLLHGQVRVIRQTDTEIEFELPKKQTKSWIMCTFTEDLLVDHVMIDNLGEHRMGMSNGRRMTVYEKSNSWLADRARHLIRWY